MKPIRLSQHALEECVERGTNENEVQVAVGVGSREPAKRGRILCRTNLDLEYNATWQSRYYSTKQVAPIIVEEGDWITS
jgi:hypothetical protein